MTSSGQRSGNGILLGKEAWMKIFFNLLASTLHADGIAPYSDDQPGARPTDDISIEFEIQSKFAVLRLKIYWTDHNKILHMSRQCNCRDVCKIVLWSVKHISK